MEKPLLSLRLFSFLVLLLVFPYVYHFVIPLTIIALYAVMATITIMNKTFVDTMACITACWSAWTDGSWQGGSHRVNAGGYKSQKGPCRYIP